MLKIPFLEGFSEFAWARFEQVFVGAGEFVILKRLFDLFKEFGVVEVRLMRVLDCVDSKKLGFEQDTI